MPKPATAPQSLIDQAALRMARLPTERLPLVLRFLEALEELQPAEQDSIDGLLEEALAQGELLAELPRAQLMARFMDLGEEIRAEAIARGTAFEEDPISA